mgnify:CR=1 FL=1
MPMYKIFEFFRYLSKRWYFIAVHKQDVVKLKQVAMKIKSFLFSFSTYGHTRTLYRNYAGKLITLDDVLASLYAAIQNGEIRVTKPYSSL